MTLSGSAASIKRGCADEVPRCKANNKSECIRIDGLVHIPAAATGHNGLAAVRSADSTGKLELDWDGGGYPSGCVYIACNASYSCCSSFTCSVHYDSLNFVHWVVYPRCPPDNYRPPPPKRRTVEGCSAPREKQAGISHPSV